MNLQVQPLKVLATRQVVMNRMDYSTYLTGTTKLELDRLDKLEGKFKIQDSNSKLTVEGSYNGKKLSSDDWDFLKSCHLPKFLVKVVERTQELSVVESKSGPRNWVMSAIGWEKKIAIYCPQGRGTLRQQLLMMH